MKTTGGKRVRTMARHTACALASCVLAFGLTLPVGAACADASDASTGQAAQVAPQAAYANSLFSEMTGSVQHVNARVGDTLRLSGDFQGGWGTVTFTWAAAEGSSLAGGSYGSVAVASLGTAPLGVYSQSDAEDATVQDSLSVAVRTQDVETASFTWRVLGSATIPGQLPGINRGVVPHGLSQTIELSDLQEGNYALRLTAQDEVGDEESIYWNVDVQEAQPTATADTNVRLLVNPTAADIDESAETRHAVWRMPARQDTASADANAQPIKASFPQTGDALGVLVALGSSIAVAAAVLALWAVSRRRSRRRS